jgi:hypothetical protein
MRPCPALALLLLALATPAAAADAVDPLAPSTSENGRYTMTPAGNGFLRLDTRTGIVSLCTVNGASAECRTAADDRAALTAEIERLAKRVAELESGSKPPGGGASRVLPNQQDMDRAMDYAEQFMRRMMRIMRDETRTPN